MQSEEPPAPGNVIFSANVSTDKVYLHRVRYKRYAITWHTWSNGSWQIDIQRHESLNVALMDVLTWIRCNVETL